MASASPDGEYAAIVAAFNEHYRGNRLGIERLDDLTREQYVQTFLVDIFPSWDPVGATMETYAKAILAKVPTVGSAKEKMGAMEKAIASVAAKYEKAYRGETESPDNLGGRELTPTLNVCKDARTELSLRRAESMISRALSMLSVSAGKNFTVDDAKDEEDLAIDEYREEMMLLFRPFTKAFDLSHLAPVSKEEFCLMPTLSHGLGYGIDLCVVPKTEPVKRGTRGPIYSVPSNKVVTVCTLHLNRSLAATFVVGQLKQDGFFDDNYRPVNLTTSPAKAAGASSHWSQGRRKRSRRCNIMGPIARFVVEDVPLPDRYEDCHVCTISLAAGGMFDDGDEIDLCSLSDCGHTFHTTCLEELAKRHGDYLQCPCCKRIYGTKVGTQPAGGTMTSRITGQSLPGHEGVSTIEISYYIPPGLQGPEHPNPGVKYHCIGFPRIAYLPDTDEGRKALRLLRRAFDQRLIFTVGTSSTTSRDNSVIWNDIHHKTNTFPNVAHGYPDPNYFNNLFNELAQHGIME